MKNDPSAKVGHNGADVVPASEKDRVQAGNSEAASKRRDWTVLEVLAWTASRFSERAMDSPRLDAELLIAHVLGISRVQLYMRAQDLLSSETLARIREVIKRRQAGLSIAAITGHKEFWGLSFEVDENVLCPRPDSETLIEDVQERAAALPPGPLRIVDVGTGPGTLVLTLAHVFKRNRQGSHFFATDVSEAALSVAGRNAARMSTVVAFRQGDLLAPLSSEPPFDVIVANLPYIPTGDISGLPPEVRHEPVLALDGGADGLELVRRLIARAPARLNPGGLLVLEIGIGQAQATAALCGGAGLVDVRVRRDLGGVDRVVSAHKPQTETRA